MLGAWTNTSGDEVVSIAGCPVITAIVTRTGALELTVHGWDIARACGRHHPIPPGLAEEILPFCPLLVTDADRPARFAAPVVVSGQGPQIN